MDPASGTHRRGAGQLMTIAGALGRLVARVMEVADELVKEDGMMEASGKRQEKAEKNDSRAKDRKRMKWWLVAVAATSVVYGALELRGSMDRYEAGRMRERIEAAERITARIEAGKRYFDQDLGVWVIPEGPKHIRVKRPVRVAKGE